MTIICIRKFGPIRHVRDALYMFGLVIELARNIGNTISPLLSDPVALKKNVEVLSISPINNCGDVLCEDA